MNDLKTRFLSHVSKTRNCWKWTACKLKRGHGRIRIGKKLILAHRVSYELFVGPIPENLWVLHKCDVRDCVNPKHLYVGTPKNNTADMFHRKRHNDRRGSKNGNSKLTEKDVAEIRKLYASKNFSQISLGRQFNVSQVQISHVVSYKHWPK